MATKTKSIKVSETAHQQLRLAAAKSSAHLYEIVDALITQEQDTVTALRHAVYRNHNYSPASCNGCRFIQELVEKYIIRKAREVAKNGKKSG